MHILLGKSLFARIQDDDGIERVMSVRSRSFDRLEIKKRMIPPRVLSTSMSSYIGCRGMRFSKPASAMSLRGAFAGLQNMTLCPRDDSSRAMGSDRVSSPRSFVGSVVKR